MQIKQFLTLNLIFFCREKISLSGTPISLPKIAYLSPRKYHMYAFSPRPLGIGIHFQTRLSPLLKVLRMVLLSPLLWWKLGTSLPGPGPGPGEWLWFWRVTIKQFWFWFWQKYFGNMTSYFQGTWTTWEGFMHPQIPRLTKNFSGGVIGMQWRVYI